MEIYIFARFHALEGKQGEVTQALEEVLGPTRNEPGCIRTHGSISLTVPAASSRERISRNFATWPTNTPR
jgi:quinol monooxygenase YgiN